MESVLYYGNNLEILRRYIKDWSGDLTCLDPPFRSDQSYNDIFKEKDRLQAASQIQAFENMWTWDQEDDVVCADMVTAGGNMSDDMQAFRAFLFSGTVLDSPTVRCLPRLLDRLTRYRN